MKPDNDHLFCDSTLVCKHDSKPFEYSNSGFDTAELEAVMKGNQNGAVNDLNTYENDAARFAPDISLKDECVNSVVEDSTNGKENDLNGSVTPCTISSSKMELFERGDGELFSDKKDSENEARNESEFRDSVAACTTPFSKMELCEETALYMDKTVMECQLPELMVCYKENTYHVVKDICIDDGVHSEDKGICTILPSNGTKNGRMTRGGEGFEMLSFNGSKSSCETTPHEVDTYELGNKEKLFPELHILDALRSLAENGFDNDISKDAGGGSLVPAQMGKTHNNAIAEIADDASREEFVTYGMASSQKFGRQISLKSLLESPDCDNDEVELQSAQILCSKETHGSPAMVAAPEEESNESNPGNDLSFNGKVENATITYNFDSSKSAASGEDGNPGNVDHEQQPFKIDVEPRNEGGVSDSLAAASEVQHSPGESSFSRLITYSGPIAFSGSVSLRSDSSTTSTRSFAFPV
ncbi:hypothetical protein U1Q18_016678 [Sarracenia purpurea var. burkii]